jgi:toxin FitB
LPFDRAAARIYGELASESRRSGRSVDVADLQIAAVARARNAAAIATRNTRHFVGCGIALVDPWLAGAPSA